MKHYDFDIQFLNDREEKRSTTDYTVMRYGVFVNYIYIFTEMVFNTNLNLDVKKVFLFNDETVNMEHVLSTCSCLRASDLITEMLVLREFLALLCSFAQS